MVNVAKLEEEYKQVLLPADTHRIFKSICARRGLSMVKVLNLLVLGWIMTETKRDEEKTDDAT